MFPISEVCDKFNGIEYFVKVPSSTNVKSPIEIVIHGEPFPPQTPQTSKYPLPPG